MLGVISVTGMALALFLIMVVMMTQQVNVIPFAPESGRDRMLHARFLSVNNESWNGEGGANGPHGRRSAETLYGDLPLGAITTIYNVGYYGAPTSGPDGKVYQLRARDVDANYWKVFDFSFVSGKPFTQADFDASRQVAVMTESSARKLFGSTDVAGRDFTLNHIPYRVAGVVKDVSSLATKAYGEVWVPYTTTGIENFLWNDGIQGSLSVTILAADRDDFPALREEINRRLLSYNTELKPTGYYIIGRDRPYDQETDAYTKWANVGPDMASVHRQQWIVYLILLIVPAINLSSMTESRLRRRVSEIGVRRAFGCPRTTLFGNILVENFIVTIIAGVVALLLSCVFALLFKEMLFTTWSSPDPMVTVGMLIQPSTFLWALAFCFVLNLLSSGIPAWRASRVNVVTALTGK